MRDVLRQFLVVEPDLLLVAQFAFGVEHELLPDGMWIRGRPGPGPAYGGGRVDSHGDHRVAMAFAVAALRAGGAIEIDDTANVATSFPGFASLARGAGLALAEL